MTAIEAALRKTDEVRWFYQRHAACGLQEVGEIFALFAEDEQRHWTAMQALSEGVPFVLEHSPTLDRARFILRRLSLWESTSAAGFAGVCFEAMGQEAESAGIYHRLALQTPPGWQRDLLLSVAAEEETHFTLLEQVRELADPVLAGGLHCAGCANAV